MSGCGHAIIHDINIVTGAPTSPSRLEGWEWNLVEIAPGLEVRQIVPNSEFPFLSSSSQWFYFP